MEVCCGRVLHCKETDEKHSSILLAWCHLSVQKMWQSNLPQNSDANIMFLAKIYPL